MKKYSKTSFVKLKVFETFKIESLKNANFDHCLKRLLGEKLLKDLLWQKLGIFKVLKLLEKIQKDKLCS